ncbi:MAG: nucleotide-binding protein [Anaerolineales bacterium]|nr:nucleotide-binding protein [Anaerolineales bacterium]
MIKRFQGTNGAQKLISSLRAQKIIHDNKDLATKIAGMINLKMIEPGEVLITQDEVDDDLYFILSGRLSVSVHGREVAVRHGGQHVGEMTLIDPSARRSASIVAIDQSVVASISENDFSKVANEYPRLWRLISVELSDRLRQRNDLVCPVNPRPVLFIGSSKESLPIAREIRSGLRFDDILIHLWTDGGVFGASRFPIEDLEVQITSSDFAVLVLGPDDRVICRDQEIDAPRDNVIFELGLFMGALKRERTFLVLPRGLDIKVPTDILGLNPIKYQKGTHDEISSLIAPVCDDLRQIIMNKGPK